MRATLDSKSSSVPTRALAPAFLLSSTKSGDHPSKSLPTIFALSLRVFIKLHLHNYCVHPPRPESNSPSRTSQLKYRSFSSHFVLIDFGSLESFTFKRDRSLTSPSGYETATSSSR